MVMSLKAQSEITAVSLTLYSSVCLSRPEYCKSPPGYIGHARMWLHAAIATRITVVTPYRNYKIYAWM